MVEHVSNRIKVSFDGLMPMIFKTSCISMAFSIALKLSLLVAQIILSFPLKSSHTYFIRIIRCYIYIYYEPKCLVRVGSRKLGAGSKDFVFQPKSVHALALAGISCPGFNGLHSLGSHLSRCGVVYDSFRTTMTERIEADGNNKSALVGNEYQLKGPFSVHQMWQRLLTKTEPSSIQDCPALILPGRKATAITFRQLDERATALAQRLWISSSQNRSASNPKDELIIAVCLPPSTELIVSLLAIFKLGGAYLPLDPSFPSNRIVHILEDAEPALLLTSKSILGDVHFDQLVQGLPVVCYDRNEQDQPLLDVTVVPKTTQDLAVVLYTSGSTGIPKGVRLTHRNIYHRLSWQWRVFPYKSGEVCCFKTALTFVDSIAEIWAPLLKAVPVVIVPKIVTQNPETFIATLESNRVTRLVLVPSLLSAMLTYIAANKSMVERPLEQLHLWVCSGEVLPPALLRQFFQLLNAQICNFYGSTEVTGDVTSVTFSNMKEVEDLQLDNRVPLGKVYDSRSRVRNFIFYVSQSSQALPWITVLFTS